MPSLAPGEPQQAGDGPAGKQLGRKVLVGPSRHEVDHEAAMCPCGKAGQQHPGLQSEELPAGSGQ